jgi:fatty acid desaturase
MNKAQKNGRDKLKMSALRVFLFFGLLIYAVAFVYCYVTRKTLAMFLIAAGGIANATLVLVLFRNRKNSD